MLFSSATGFPIPEIHWLKQGQQLEQFQSWDGNSILEMRISNQNQSGEYRCVASNELGEEQASAIVEVINEGNQENTQKQRSHQPMTVVNCLVIGLGFFFLESYCLFKLGTRQQRRRVIWELASQKLKGGQQQLDQNGQIAHVKHNGSLVFNRHLSDEEIHALPCSVDGRKGAPQGVRMDVQERSTRAQIRLVRIVSRPLYNITIDCRLKTGSAIGTQIHWSRNNVPIVPEVDKFEILVFC